MPQVAAKKQKVLPGFNTERFLATIGHGRTILNYKKKEAIFTQGDACEAVFYIQGGKVKLTVVSTAGKEATIGILDAGDFFGEGSLSGHRCRMGSAMTVTECTILRIEKVAMLEVLHTEQKFSEMFVEYLLLRNLRYQEDLVDQLFNSSEKRLARILLLFAGFGKDNIPATTAVSKISQETLAEMVGTTRSRVSFFMNKFRRLGFIEYNGGLKIHSSLLSVVLHD
jgi:CRP/FNR family transcriptional regulator, cyclic AMP receptor protein